MIPNRGAWLEYETDSNGILYVKIDRQRKVHITALVRALGYGSNPQILDLFGDDERLSQPCRKTRRIPKRKASSKSTSVSARRAADGRKRPLAAKLAVL